MWRDLAACNTYIWDTDIYQERGDVFYDAEKEEDQQLALDMCATCPVRWDCLQRGLNPPPTDKNDRWVWGTWGGAKEEDLMVLVNEKEDGKPRRKMLPNNLTCPFCKHVGCIETTAVKRTRRKLECTYCGLTWWSKIKMDSIPIDDDEDE